jgi:hypothetical protein
MASLSTDVSTSLNDLKLPIISNRKDSFNENSLLDVVLERSKAFKKSIQ